MYGGGCEPKRRQEGMMEALKEYWAILMGAIGFVAWLVRLEAMTKTNVKELLRLEEQMDRDRSDARDSRKETNDILKEVRSDIKQLIREGRVQHFTDRTIPPGRS